jgi:hypothetical protein
MSLSIIIIDKLGNLKTLNIKNYCEEELYKKCGFKKENDFMLQTSWSIQLNNLNYTISMYGKTCGKKNFENVFKFPHPIDNKLFYGSCALIAKLNGENINLKLNLWEQLYQLLLQNDNSQSNVTFLNNQLNDDINLTKKKKDSKNKDKDKNKDKEMQQEIIEYDDIELKEDPYYYSSDDDNDNDDGENIQKNEEI